MSSVTKCSSRSFKLIDIALGAYYKNFGYDYYEDTAHHKGKFRVYMEDEQFDEHDIEEELGSYATYENCSYLDFDINFPLSSDANDNSLNRSQQIFKILQTCYNFAPPPQIESSEWYEWCSKLIQQLKPNDNNVIHNSYRSNCNINMNSLQSPTTIIINSCISRWKRDKNILLYVNQPYTDTITNIIIQKYNFIYSVYYTLEQIKWLNIGDHIDYRLPSGIYVPCVILSNDGNKLKISTNCAENSSYDIPVDDSKQQIFIENYSCNNSIHKNIVKPNAITSRISHQLTSIGFANIFVNSPLHPGWRKCWIDSWYNVKRNVISDALGYAIIFDCVYGQVQIEYEIDKQKYKWWVHLDDNEEFKQHFNSDHEWQFSFRENMDGCRAYTWQMMQFMFYPFSDNKFDHDMKAIKYDHIFNEFIKHKGQIKIKMVQDIEWVNVDEVGLYILMKHLTNIGINETKQTLGQLLHKCTGLWIYKYNGVGYRILGPHSTKSLFGSDQFLGHNKIFIKRVGERNWYQTNDINLTILFHYLDIHNDVTVPMGTQYIEHAIVQACKQPLLPHFEYDEWEIIGALMKAMNMQKYFDELKSFCIEQQFEEIESVVDDLDEFINSPVHDGSIIMDNFKQQFEYDNDKWIKLGFIIYHSCKLLPIFESWTDIIDENYLEKWFSYARCRPEDHKHGYCRIIERLQPLDQYVHLYNTEICYIPNEINNASIHWITHTAFFNVLPHYNKDRLKRDCSHLKQ
eukprot:478088_1